MSLRKFSILLIAVCLIFSFRGGATNGEDQVREYIAQCLVHIEQNEFVEALVSLDAALLLQGTNPELYRLQGQVLEILERPDEAVSAWKNCQKFTDDPVLREESIRHIENLNSD